MPAASRPAPGWALLASRRRAAAAANHQLGRQHRVPDLRRTPVILRQRGDEPVPASRPSPARPGEPWSTEDPCAGQRAVVEPDDGEIGRHHQTGLAGRRNAPAASASEKQSSAVGRSGRVSSSRTARYPLSGATAHQTTVGSMPAGSTSRQPAMRLSWWLPRSLLDPRPNPQRHPGAPGRPVFGHRPGPDRSDVDAGHLRAATGLGARGGEPPGLRRRRQEYRSQLASWPARASVLFGGRIALIASRATPRRSTQAAPLEPGVSPIRIPGARSWTHPAAAAVRSECRARRPCRDRAAPRTTGRRAGESSSRPIGPTPGRGRPSSASHRPTPARVNPVAAGRYPTGPRVILATRVAAGEREPGPTQPTVDRAGWAAAGMSALSP